MCCWSIFMRISLALGLLAFSNESIQHIEQLHEHGNPERVSSVSSKSLVSRKVSRFALMRKFFRITYSVCDSKCNRCGYNVYTDRHLRPTRECIGTPTIPGPDFQN